MSQHESYEAFPTDLVLRASLVDADLSTALVSNTLLRRATRTRAWKRWRRAYGRSLIRNWSPPSADREHRRILGGGGGLEHWWWKLTAEGWLALVATGWFASGPEELLSEMRVTHRAEIAQSLVEGPRTAAEVADLCIPHTRTSQSAAATKRPRPRLTDQHRMAQVERHLGRLALVSAVQAEESSVGHHRRWHLTASGRRGLAALTDSPRAPT